jgi:hypothetical protein
MSQEDFFSPSEEDMDEKVIRDLLRSKKPFTLTSENIQKAKEKLK